MKRLITVLSLSAALLGLHFQAAAATTVVRTTGVNPNANANANGPLAPVNNPNANNGNAVIPDNGYNPNLGMGCANSGNVPKKCRPSGS